MISIKGNRFFYILLSLIFIILVVLACVLDGTNGGGDSIYHYLIARYSWAHPELLFNHWGKPVFTMISSPFTHLGGFHGIKIFNVTVTVLACLFTYLSAKKMKMNNAVAVLLFFFCAPAVINTALSGLTEPLFSFILIVGIYLFLLERSAWAVFVLSFLPMARSEGLIVLCVVGFYLLVTKRFKILPLLLAGQFVIALLGFSVYGDILWVFNKIPYAKLSTNYWKGPWYHFLEQMPYVIGPVSFGLLCIGFLYFTFSFFKRLYQKQAMISHELEHLLLVYGIFGAFFFSHSLFHYLGIFGEMGLTRVFVGVMPLMAIGCLDGLNVLLSMPVPAYAKKAFTWVLSLAAIFYCFGNTPFSLSYHRDIVQAEDQRFLSQQIAPYLNQKHHDKTLFLSNVSLGYYLDRDIFNEEGSARMLFGKKPNFFLGKDELIVWDNWFSPVEEAVKAEDLQNNPHLQLDTSFYYKTSWGQEVSYMIFKSR